MSLGNGAVPKSRIGEFRREPANPLIPRPGGKEVWKYKSSLQRRAPLPFLSSFQDDGKVESDRVRSTSQGEHRL